MIAFVDDSSHVMNRSQNASCDACESMKHATIQRVAMMNVENAMSNRNRNRRNVESQIVTNNDASIDACDVDNVESQIVEQHVERVTHDDVERESRVRDLLIALQNATSKNAKKSIRAKLRKNAYYISREKRRIIDDVE
jgi:hypothetical protein